MTDALYTTQAHLHNTTKENKMEQIKKTKNTMKPTNNRLAELQSIAREANNSNAFIPMPRLKITETVRSRICNRGWTDWVRTSEFGMLKLMYRRAAWGYSLFIEPSAQEE